jgi:hypothetical protein
MLFDNGEEDDGKDADLIGSVDDDGIVVEGCCTEFDGDDVMLVMLDNELDDSVKLLTFDEENDDVSSVMLFNDNEDFNDREVGEKVEGEEEDNLSEPKMLKLGNSKLASIFDS